MFETSVRYSECPEVVRTTHLVWSYLSFRIKIIERRGDSTQAWRLCGCCTVQAEEEFSGTEEQ